MKGPKILLRLGMFVALIGFMGFALSSWIMKDWLIIGYGIRAQLGIRRITSLLLIIGGACICGSGFLRLRAMRRERKTAELQAQEMLQREEAEKEAIRRENSLDSMPIRLQMQRLQNQMPLLANLFDTCFRQLDRFSSLQKKQQALIASNDASYLEETVGVFDNVERRICKNFRNIMNLCIASGDTMGDPSMYDIDQYLDDNDQRLDEVYELVKASAEWINQYNNGTDNNYSEVENWIAVIRESLREG